MYIPLKIIRKTQNKIDKLRFSALACAQNNTVLMLYYFELRISVNL